MKGFHLFTFFNLDLNSNLFPELGTNSGPDILMVVLSNISSSL